MVEDNQRAQDSQRFWWKEPDFATNMGMMVVFALFVLIVVRTLFLSDTPEIVIQANDSQMATLDASSAVAYAERISRTAEWTIGAVLTLGSALIGLNWYTSRRNYEDEKDRVAQLEFDLNGRLSGATDDLVQRLEAAEQELIQVNSVLVEMALKKTEDDAIQSLTSNRMDSPMAFTMAVITISNGVANARNIALTYDKLPSGRIRSVIEKLVRQFALHYKFWQYPDTKWPVDSMTDFVLNRTSDDVKNLASTETFVQWMEARNRFILDPDLPNPFEKPDSDESPLVSPSKPST